MLTSGILQILILITKTYSVIVASEAINVIDKRQFGGNVALKVDIKKAFDTLDWNFLIAVLQQFGFATVFTKTKN